MNNQNRSPQQPAPIEWKLWLKWVLATTVGWIVGWTVVGEAGVGVVIGLLQWLILRQPIDRAGWWVAASAVGWTTGWVIIISGVVVPPEGGLITVTVAGAVIGTTLGLAQWLILRQKVPAAGWWIPANTIGWAFGLTGLLGSAVAGAVAGAITGFALDWLVRHSDLEI